MRARRAALTAALVALALAVPLTAVAATPAPPPPPPPVPAPAEPLTGYRVDGLLTAEQRTEVSRQGVDVLGGGADHLDILATPEQADRLRAEGRTLTPLDLPGLPGVPGAPALPSVPSVGGDFPLGSTGYHTYGEVMSDLADVARAHPDLVSLTRFGRSVEGRDLPLVKISDGARADRDVPEVLFTCGQHAREHLTVEMCLHIVHRLADGFGHDPAITATLRGREVWVAPTMNPDGAEHDISSGLFTYWRKNRQATPNSTAVGTDLNRNWATGWGCCGGSSDQPSSEVYRGPAPFSAPETAQLRDFVASRVIDGRQQIAAHIDFHTFGELVMWPYGYTMADTAPGIGSAASAAFRALGRAMAGTNGYTPQQSSDLYITDGGIGDWMWAEHRIWSYTFEMYPTDDLSGGFYPPDTVIARETTRNDAAVDLLLNYADCVPRILNAACTPLP